MGSIVQTERKPAAVEPVAMQQEQHQYLTFALGGETYAMGILSIREIIEYGNLTGVPGMPEFIRGVINIRGAAVPVIDLSARFGKHATAVTRRSCIVIVEVANGDETQDIGVMVDGVNEVLEIPAGEIEPPPSFGVNVRADFICGMGNVGGRFVVILDIHHVLSMDEMAALVSAGSRQETDSSRCDPLSGCAI